MTRSDAPLCLPLDEAVEQTAAASELRRCVHIGVYDDYTYSPVNAQRTLKRSQRELRARLSTKQEAYIPFSQFFKAKHKRHR